MDVPHRWRNPDKHDPDGKHGNENYGLARMEIQLHKGKPFDERWDSVYLEVLHAWGYDETEPGIFGDFVRVVARGRTFLYALDGAQRMAARVGDIRSFLELEARYGKRRPQVGRDMLRILEEQQEEANVHDYETEAAELASRST